MVIEEEFGANGAKAKPFSDDGFEVMVRWMVVTVGNTPITVAHANNSATWQTVGAITNLIQEQRWIDPIHPGNDVDQVFPNIDVTRFTTFVKRIGMNQDRPVLIVIRNPVICAGEWATPFLGKMMAMMLVGSQHRSQLAWVDALTVCKLPF